jgi:hypothetical protein
MLGRFIAQYNEIVEFFPLFLQFQGANNHFPELLLIYVIKYITVSIDEGVSDDKAIASLSLSSFVIVWQLEISIYYADCSKEQQQYRKGGRTLYYYLLYSV